MREIQIRENEAGQRLDKFLKKFLSQAPASFLYKMMRKKNIVLNGKKADGSEKLREGDCVKFFLSDETIQKFSGEANRSAGNVPQKFPGPCPEILYEDEHVLFLNKPAGLLSQKAEKNDVSAADFVVWYLRNSGQLTPEDLRAFCPSICNRLDRNTSGLIAAGKSLAGLQAMTELFRERSLKKYYLCIVKGKVSTPSHIRGYLSKDERTNRVRITDQAFAGASPIETAYAPLSYSQENSLIKVHLITGRTHQIRAHLAAQGHPILGDGKYGDPDWNEKWRRRTGIRSQLLHAWELVMPPLTGTLEALSEQTIQAPLPEAFARQIKETAWQHGIQEAFGVLP